MSSGIWLVRAIEGDKLRSYDTGRNELHVLELATKTVDYCTGKRND